MSELSITPNFDKKTAKIKGTIAGGEHIEVTLKYCSNLPTAGLRFRFVHCDKTVAVYPLDETDKFSVDDTDLRFVLNANTVELLKAMTDEAVRNVAIVLDDPSDAVRKMYFTELHSIQKWVMIDGVDTPVSLDDYPSDISDLTSRLDELEEQLIATKEERASLTSDLASAIDTVNDWDEHIKTIEKNTTNNTNLINELTGGLATLTTSIESTIEAERKRAESVESALSKSIATENERAIAEEDAIAESITTAVEAEKSRAMSVELSLNELVSTEVGRAQRAESTLSARIDSTYTKNEVDGMIPTLSGEFKTNTLSHLRDTVKAIVIALGGKVS